MATFNKLVRDNIPGIISADGKTPVTRVLKGEEFKEALFRKLSEETEEVCMSSGHTDELKKELADVFEVLDTIILLMQLDEHEIKTLQSKRRAERGGFEKRIYLESIQ